MANNEYPRMLYHPDGRAQVVNDEATEKEFGGEWGRQPFEIHRNPLGAGPATNVMPDNVIGGNNDHIEKIAQRVCEILEDRLGLANRVRNQPERVPAAPNQAKGQSQ